MKFKLFLFLLGTLLLGVTSCKEEPFNPREGWKDITIVYGLINPMDSVHYIRVNKAYLGEGNAIIMAQNPDSLYYPSGDISVYFKEYDADGKVLLDNILLEETILDEKDTGMFVQKNIVYKFTKSFNVSTDLDNIPKIEIVNEKTGKIISAETQFVNFAIQNRSISFTWKTTTPVQITFNSLSRVKQMDVYFTYFYGEAPSGTREESQYEIHSITWKMGSILTNSTMNQVSFSYIPRSFFEFLRNHLEDNPNVWRISKKEGYLTVWGGSEDMYYYMNVNKPSGIILEKPEYTNITSNTGEEDAFGLFSTRIHRQLHIKPIPWDQGFLEIERQFVEDPMNQ